MKELTEPLDSTTVQEQLFMEGNKFILDLRGTGAVVTGAEIQQDVDLQQTIKREEQMRMSRGVRRDGVCV